MYVAVSFIGVVDKLFARIGASDNVANQQSTFQLEMTETAHILNNATPNSFVILDELGMLLYTGHVIGMGSLATVYRLVCLDC